jgi:decaprenyl-phosphate phosphoribosyltransferase
MNFKNIIKPLRIDHWVKNLVIFFGYIVALLYFPDFEIDLKSILIGFLILCISASSNYLINEYFDRKSDRFHPVKKWRYFAKEKSSAITVFINYILLISVSILLSLLINKSFFYLNIFFLLCGVLYNIKPLRVKDIFILDVVLESVNNPTRFLMGWFLISPNLLPPISIIFFLWFVGCFLMTMKRYSEYKFIKQKKINPELYRLSFKNYNSQNLFNISLFYCLISFFFFTIFIIKYKIELLLIVPCVCYLYIHIFYIAQKKNSIIMKIEKIYKDKIFIFIFIILLLTSYVLLEIKIDFLNIFESKNLLKLF